ncbi:MAG: tRNA 2-thiouridine(34) synthase MnmA, partial [Bacteroidetes bacterium]|nr:tRNA 2-thiouridine(34) synthase MnmA [Bacteroidota bacterium]
RINPIKVADFVGERDAVGKIRYKDEGAPCVVWQEGEKLHVRFAEPRRAITPGQAVVLYEGEDVLGGAWIQAVGEPAVVG